MTISQDLQNMITKLFLFWFSYQCRTILWSQQTATGKKQKPTKMPCQWWLKYQNNRLVSWRLNCNWKILLLNFTFWDFTFFNRWQRLPFIDFRDWFSFLVRAVMEGSLFVQFCWNIEFISRFCFSSFSLICSIKS